MAIDQARQDRAAVEFEDPGARRVRDPSPCADSLDARAFDDHHCVRDRSATGAIDQGAAFQHEHPFLSDDAGDAQEDCRQQSAE